MKEIFDEVLGTFENNGYRNFAEKCLDNAPKYWYTVPASSTGKYHPAYALGDGGLVRHTIALIRFLNHMFSVNSIWAQFTSRERDLLRVSGIVHDMWKSGTQEEFENSKYTKFDHPLIAAEHIIKMGGLPDVDLKFIAHAVESHMGAFNTDKRHPDITLPEPTDKFQIILHLADYLASRKDIEMKFDNVPEAEPQPLPDINTWQMNFGKYKGMTLPEIEALHPDYIAWIQKQEGFDKEPCKSLLIQMGYKFS